MIRVRIQFRDGTDELLALPDVAVIGKSPQCELPLRGWFVGKEHARLFRAPLGVMVEDLGGGVHVNGRKTSHQGPLSPEDVLEVAGYRIVVMESVDDEMTVAVKEDLAPEVKALRMVGVPYTDDEIAKAGDEVTGKSELDAVVAYLQVLGTALKNVK